MLVVQALYDWLFRQPRGVVLEDNPEVMADIFGNSHTQFKVRTTHRPAVTTVIDSYASCQGGASVLT